MNLNKSQVIKGADSDFVFVIGLEVHAQVKSKSKLFSSSSTQFGAEPNSIIIKKKLFNLKEDRLFKNSNLRKP